MSLLPVIDPPMPRAEAVTPLGLSELPASASFAALYVHVPFCVHKCHYCDFYSITRQSPGRMARFVDRVLAEADRWGDVAADLRTVFFGGGTPSLLPAAEMRRLCLGLRERLDLSQVDEWTVEVNPNHVDAAYFEGLAAAGVDRVSFGAQSFVAAELAVLERDHDPACVAPAIEAARRAGIRRQSIDLIHAIPGQTAESLAGSLEAAIGLDVEHVSCYALTYEPNTPLAVRRRLGRVDALEEDEELAMFRQVRMTLTHAGLAPYELSNFARAGAACRHNLAYWAGDDYLGLGPAAASHAAGVRWRNEPHLGRWEAAIDAGGLPIIDREALDPRARAGELMWLKLRCTSGVDVADFSRRTGRPPADWFGAALADLSAIGLLDVTPTRVRLTGRGVELGDAVAAELLAR